MAIGSSINTATMAMTFDGEFATFVASPDGSTGLWQTSMANGNRTLGNNGELEYYSDSSVGSNPFSVQNGTLDIAATPGSNPLGLPYNSGVITTEGSFNQLYGYFQITAEMPAGQGLWPAFWLLPASGAWPPELDAFEVLGSDPTTLYFSTHSTAQATQGTALSVANVSAGFNTYGVMWGPQTVDLYINNIEVASMPTPADMNVPMYMLANLAVGGYWPGSPNAGTVFPANMLISSIKAYAYPGTTGGTVYDTLPAQNTGPAALAPVISVPASLSASPGTATALSGVSFAANWPGGNFTVRIGDTAGLLATAATADVFTSGEASDYLTLTGNLAPLQAALASLTYTAAASGTEWIWVNVQDPQGLQSNASIIATAAPAPAAPHPVAPSPVAPAPAAPSSSAPAITAPATAGVVLGTATPLSGFGLTGTATTSLSVTLSDSTGLLSTAAAAGISQTGEGSTSLTLSGGLAAIAADLASLTLQAPAAGTDWLWISATTGAGAQILAHTIVTATAPSVIATTITAPATAGVTAGAATALPGIVLAGGNGALTISDSAGLLSTLPASGVTATDEGTNSLTLSGGLAAINADLASLTFQTANPGTDWLWLSTTAASGAQILAHTIVTATAPVRVTPPTLTAPATISLASGSTSPLSGISIANAQPGDAFSVTVSDSAGLLSAAPASGVTAQGQGSTSLSLAGGLAAINADLATLSLQAATSAGTDWLWVSAIGPDGTQVLAHTVVTTTPPLPAGPPVILVPAAASIATGSTAPLPGISVTDPKPDGAFSVTLSDSTGLLFTPAAAGVTAQGEGSNSLTLSGGLAAINADLVSLTYQAGITSGADWLWVSANDPSGVQASAPLVMQFVTPAPGFSLLGLSDTTLPAAAGPLTATLSVLAGRLSAPAESGIALSGNGTASLVLQGSASALNAELTALTYAGNAGTTSDTLTIAPGAGLSPIILHLLGGHLTA